MIIKPNETETKGIIVVGIITVAVLWLMMIPGDKVEASFKILFAIGHFSFFSAFSIASFISSGK